ncbi:glycosyltransferase family 4 protein [Candidatus Omnitrophota bacterium]
MNICFLSRDYPPNLLGGVGTYTYEMARALTKLGHQVYVISEAIGQEGEFIEDGICVHRVRPMELPLPFFLKDKFKMTWERLEYSFAVSRRLRAIVKVYKIDVVESCEARSEGFWYYLFHSQPPLVIKLHTPEGIVFKLDRLPQTIDNKVKDKLEEWWILRANKIVPVTKAVRDLVSQYYQVKLGNLQAAYYPVNTLLFKPDGQWTGNNFPKILYAGRLEVRKGVQVLLEAIPEVLKKYAQAHFYFVGADAGVKYLLERRIKELGCSANITFIEQVAREEMPAYYHGADLCVFPSLWENFAFVALEAMACAKVVIASRVGGFSEMIDEGLNGILCQPGDSQELADKITFALRDKLLMEMMGQRARKKIVDHHRPIERARQLVEAYQELL